MSVKDMHPDNLPSSDLPEILGRLEDVRDGLNEPNDDWTRQEIYDRLNESAIIIGDLINDLRDIDGVLLRVVNA